MSQPVDNFVDKRWEAFANPRQNWICAGHTLCNLIDIFTANQRLSDQIGRCERRCAGSRMNIG
jgi:hypothetical protein